MDGSPVGVPGSVFLYRRFLRRYSRTHISTYHAVLDKYSIARLETQIFFRIQLGSSKFNLRTISRASVRIASRCFSNCATSAGFAELAICLETTRNSCSSLARRFEDIPAILSHWSDLRTPCCRSVGYTTEKIFVLNYSVGYATLSLFSCGSDTCPYKT